ncbi:MAG TPA: prepilin-type N-terminal cleavage/methylation domain-containing protein, partial [Phycisphaerales bacterium]|nr:prepilin-type N-terminal cleavage/methylation domain-containing protein [Phycisphaerales bacterium]
MARSRREGFAPSARVEPGFTLIELLVVVAVLAVLIGILLPVLGTARESARLTQCLANLRSQEQGIELYANDYGGSLPPMYVWRLAASGQLSVQLINRILATYQEQSFNPTDQPDYPVPTGAFRCPDISPDNEREMWTHSGYLHHAPNFWLFNTVRINESAAFTSVQSSELTGWSGRYGNGGWRRIDRIWHAEWVVSLLDNVNYYFVGHGHREAHESIGEAEQLIVDDSYPPSVALQNRMSHQRVGKHPAV